MEQPYRTAEAVCAAARAPALDLEELLLVVPLWLVSVVDTVHASRAGSPHLASALVVSLGLAAAAHRLLSRARDRRAPRTLTA